MRVPGANADALPHRGVVAWGEENAGYATQPLAHTAGAPDSTLDGGAVNRSGSGMTMEFGRAIPSSAGRT